MGDVLGVAADFDNNMLWFSKNGVYPNGGNPATQTGAVTINFTGDLFPAVAFRWVNQAVKVHFDPSGFTYSPPSGFNAGWY